MVPAFLILISCFVIGATNGKEIYSHEVALGCGGPYDPLNIIFDPVR